jgi:hypothetical protein
MGKNAQNVMTVDIIIGGLYNDYARRIDLRHET